MNEAYTTNPFTGNLIKVGGATYKKIMKSIDGSGSKTRGWKEDSPKRGKERTTMKEKCGNKCFLSPDEDKYPICSKNTCNPDCRGIISAKVRSGQYKDAKVMALAKKAEQKYC